MGQALSLLLLFCLLSPQSILKPIFQAPPASGGSFDVGFDFRATQIFVTDPSCCTYEISTTVDYPTTRTVNGSSVTFGWESITGSGTFSTRDRSSGNDPRIAGVTQVTNDGTSTATFRVDLPNTGAYKIGLGFGDATSAQNTTLAVEDTSSAFITLSAVATTGTQYVDAAGNVWTSSATWVSSNVTVAHTFSSTILRLKLGPLSSTRSSVISHLRITKQ